jgi:hypothetical protein
MASNIAQLTTTFSSMNLSKNIPLLAINFLRGEIFSYMGGENQYWKTIFSKTVVPQLSWKDYFDHKVIPELNKGYRLVGLWTGPCSQCREDGYALPNPMCPRCSFLEPCWNCYWYNPDPYSVGNGCHCSKETRMVSWEEINMSELRKKYPRYWDFIRGKAYQDFLEEQAQLALQMREEERQAEIEIERYYIQVRENRVARMMQIQTRMGEILSLMSRLNRLALLDPMGPHRQAIGRAFQQAQIELDELMASL